MGNAVANAIDWYVDKLNKLHLVPVNAATMLRDISAKQLGGPGFHPRPLTADNFTDAELDAIHSLSRVSRGKGEYGSITGDSYHDLKKMNYGEHEADMSDYLSPLRSVSTTIGQASVSPIGDDHELTDTYDFNVWGVPVVKNFDGSMMDEHGYTYNDENELMKSLLDRDRREYNSTYARIRRNMYRLGHTDKDPDKEKIHVKLTIGDIKRRLGDRIGKLDITKPVQKKDFVYRSAGAGALTGAPIGAMLGALAGAIRLINKKDRKNWLKMMLWHILGGATIASAVGAVGGGYSAGKVYDRFKKKASDEYDHMAALARHIRRIRLKRRKRKKQVQMSPEMVKLIAYLVPAAILGTSSYAAASSARNGFENLVSDTDTTRSAYEISEMEPEYGGPIDG